MKKPDISPVQFEIDSLTREIEQDQDRRGHPGMRRSERERLDQHIKKTTRRRNLLRKEFSNRS